MKKRERILIKIKDIVQSIEPGAKIILYGSFARGDNRKESDIDLLILIEKESISQSDEKRIKYPLFDLEFDTGQIISPMLYTTKDWEENHSITLLYENIKRDGIEL